MPKNHTNLIRKPDFKIIYAIGAIGSWTPYDFRINFYSEKIPGENIESYVNDAQVVLSPSAAREFAIWLMKNIKEYEKMTGEELNTKELEVKTIDQRISEIKDDLKKDLKEVLKTELEKEIKTGLKNDLQKDLTRSVKASVQKDLKIKPTQIGLSKDLKRDLHKDLKKDLKADLKRDLQKDLKKDIKTAIAPAVQTELKKVAKTTTAAAAAATTRSRAAKSKPGPKKSKRGRPKAKPKKAAETKKVTRRRRTVKK